MRTRETLEDMPAGLSRADFLKGVGAAGAVIGGTALLAGCAKEAEESEVFPVGVNKWDYDVDVVVAGAGNGGLTAACSAAQNGAKVLLLEISAKTGGGTVYSGGLIALCGLQTYEEYTEYTEGLHDPELGKTLVETYHQEYIPWLEENNIYFTPGSNTGIGWNRDPMMGKGEPGQAGLRLFMDSLEDVLVDNGGIILTKTRAVKLLTDDSGRIVGLRARAWSTSPVETNQPLVNIKAQSVILATGNFTENTEMMTKYVGPNAYRRLPYGTPYNRGDGMLMAQELGAALSTGMNSTCGQEIAVTPGPFVERDPDLYEEALATAAPESLRSAVHGMALSAPIWNSLNPAWSDPAYGPHLAIMVNMDGKRFIDETGPIDSKRPRRPQAILQQKQGIAYMIGDQAIYDAYPGSKAMIDPIVEAGGKVVVANTLEELANGLAEQGVYGGVLLKTIAEYNKAIDDGTTMELSPPRYQGLNKISTAPFYAIPITTGAYLTYGGVAINKNAEVLDNQRVPIPGLYAVPPAAGGIMNVVYSSAIGAAGVFGLIAGKNAATRS